MSYVTSITIAVDYASPDFVEAVTAEADFGLGEFTTHLRQLDMDGAGGTKGIAHEVFAAGLNYADREMLVAWVDALPWSGRVGVVLIDTEGYEPEALVYGIEPRAAV